MRPREPARIDRTLKELGELKKWLLSAKTRFRQQAKMAMAVEELLHSTGDE